uniref:Cytokinin-O-glucosyltransferase 2 n=1 Tax=Aegilops tauschii TaxID=37682 RepID=M8BQ73_AEGTA
MAAEMPPQPHAVCLPYPAQGHIAPMLNVAKLLHARGFHVTFVNSEYNHARLVRTRGAAAMAGAAGVRFATIPDGMQAPSNGEDDDLTDGYLDMPVEDVPGLKSMRLRDFPTFIRTTDPDEFMVRYAIKETERAAGATAVILNSFGDLESEAVEAMEPLLGDGNGKPKVYTVGPLSLLAPRSTSSTISSLSLWKEQEECLQWLQGKEPASVVYVNFGSIVVMTSEQLVEFAWGLANSGQHFMWVIRPDLVRGDSAVLPPEFLTETAGRRLMASWCPQQEVLNHPAVGAFLTHSGWNSTLESMCGGVPVISWPFFGDQQTNCRYQCKEWGVGMEIDSNVQRDAVTGLIAELMDGEKGKQMRKRAEEWQEKAIMAAKPGGSSHRNFDELVRDVLLPKTGDYAHDVAGTSGENEGSKKAKKKNKKKYNLCGFKARFNSKRLAEIGKQFKHKNKSITFSKLMVKMIFNVPSGDRPVKLLKKSDEHDLRSIYKEGNRAPIAHVVKLLTSCSEEDVVMINRTWALLALATVFCPGTGNMVNLEYLASLEDMSLVHEFAWDEHLLARAMEEVGVFQEKKRMQANTEKAVEFQIASCLPMLAIIYMDHIDIPPGLPNEHAIDYSVPRIRFVCQKDFDWLDKVDKNKLTLVQPFYGKHTQVMAAFLFLSPLMFCFPRSGVCATPPMQHNSWDRKLVLKQPVGRELVLKHLILLKQDPSTFQLAKLMAELERAMKLFKVQKFDLLFFTIVHDRHWIVVCANLLHKQWNVFDSIHSKGKQSPLKKQANNLITNFTTLAQECSEFNVNVGSFARVDLEDYPKQDTLKTWRDTASMWHTTFSVTQ